MLKPNVIKLVLLVSHFCFHVYAQTPSFKDKQLKNERVKEAYESKWENLQSDLKSQKIDPTNFDIYLRAFKHDAVLEVWVKSKNDVKYKLFKTYDICAPSGDLGPKRKEGDGQVPEGFYEIDLFNPKSNYH